jgi:hypothetical protein
MHGLAIYASYVIKQEHIKSSHCSCHFEISLLFVPEFAEKDVCMELQYEARRLIFQYYVRASSVFSKKMLGALVLH